jgi:hypothetical protein
MIRIVAKQFTAIGAPAMILVVDPAANGIFDLHTSPVKKKPTVT